MRFSPDPASPPVCTRCGKRHPDLSMTQRDSLCAGYFRCLRCKAIMGRSSEQQLLRAASWTMKGMRNYEGSGYCRDCWPAHKADIQAAVEASRPADPFATFYSCR
jgi:hypothetical protein